MDLQDIVSKIRALPVEDRRTLIDLIGQTLPDTPVDVDQASELTDDSPEAYLAAIQNAITDDAPIAAYRLAERGSQLYPDNKELAKAARILAPPRVTILENSTDPKQADTMRWLQEHGSDYIGRWVAVRDGVFLGSAATRKALIADFGIEQSPDVMITWLPDEL